MFDLDNDLDKAVPFGKKRMEVYFLDVKDGVLEWTGPSVVA